MFSDNLYFTKPLERIFFPLYLTDNFDITGFEMTRLESEYANHNGEFYYEKAIKYKWLETKKYHPNIFINHSYICKRCGFKDSAYVQIKSHLKENPQLIKLLNIRPKIGADLSFEIIDENYYSELLHIEQDFWDIKSFYTWIENTEKFLDKIDWDFAIQRCRQIDQQNKHLSSDDISDLKAQSLGFSRTYNTYNCIV